MELTAEQLELVKAMTNETKTAEDKRENKREDKKNNEVDINIKALSKKGNLLFSINKDSNNGNLYFNIGSKILPIFEDEKDNMKTYKWLFSMISKIEINEKETKELIDKNDI
jgi:hypothetical protein